MSMNRAEQQAYQDWLDLCERISNTTKAGPESDTDREMRKERLKGNFEAFCDHYFPDFKESPFAWFHKQAAKKILADPRIWANLEWPRGHAKSMVCDVFIPMYLYANAQLDGLIMVSNTLDKTKGLLGDLQAQFVANNLWKADYGNMAALGDWRDGQFSTSDGIGFWAFGRGQSPRGARKGGKRPNVIIIDDADDKEIVKNIDRVRAAVDWIQEDLYFCFDPSKGGRVLMVGNRIHKQSILAHIVGDVEEGDPKHPSRWHSKVYAIENPKTHAKADFDTPGAQPAWKERLTFEKLQELMSKVGSRAARRELFHEHIDEGTVFLHQWIQWGKPPSIDSFDEIIVYTDPSFKNTKASDYKAEVAVGRKGRQLWILDAWVRKASIGSMVARAHDTFEKYRERARYYVEANMLQDLFLDEYTTESIARGYTMPIRADKRSKPDKYTRIENLTPLFERGLFWFNEAKRKDPDMEMLKQQFLSFPGGHDDGPDAVEGATSLLQGGARSEGFRPRMGRTVKSGRG